MKRPISLVVVVAMSGIALSACASGTTTSPATTTPPPSSMPMSAQAPSSLDASSDCGTYIKDNPDAKVTTTKDYVMVASVGPSEAMCTSEQVTAQKPTSGELMVSGMMHDMGSMAMDTETSMSHVEVHICSKATGSAVTGAMPSMTLSQESTSSMKSKIMVSEMTGLDGNTADTHYGNNVNVMDGRNYSLRVTLNAQSGTFTIATPKKSG